jgi:hypothetical protein
MTPETRRKAFRTVVGYAAAATAGSVVSALVKNNLPEPKSPHQLLKFGIGTAVFSAMAGQQVKAYANGEINDLYDLLDSFKTEDENPEKE